MAASRACASTAAIHKDWSKVGPPKSLDLLAMENGGRGWVANDEHFGRVENLTAPGAGQGHGRRLGDPPPPGAGP